MLDPQVIPTNTPATNISPADTIKSRYATCLALLKEYVDFLAVQRTTSKESVLADVQTCVDSMVDSFSFGSVFVDEIELYVVKKFQYNFNSAYSRMLDAESHEGVLKDTLELLKSEHIIEKFGYGFDRLFE